MKNLVLPQDTSARAWHQITVAEILRQLGFESHQWQDFVRIDESEEVRSDTVIIIKATGTRICVPDWLYRTPEQNYALAVQLYMELKT